DAVDSLARIHSNLCALFNLLRGSHTDIDHHMKGAADTHFTFEPDASTHQRGELTADTQTQTGAAETPRGRCVGLCEGFEDAVLRGGRNADAGVGDADVQRATFG